MWGCLKMLGIWIVIHLFALAGVWMFHRRDSDFGRAFSGKVKDYFQSAFYTAFILEAFLFLLICALIEIKLGSGATIVVSYVFCYVFAAICLCATVFSAAHYCRFRRDPESRLAGRFSVLYDGFKTRRWYNSMYYIVFNGRRLLLAVLVTFMVATGHYFKMVPFFLQQLSYCAYVVVCRPYEAAVENLIEAINELTFLVLAGCFVVMKSEEWWSAPVQQAALWCLTLSNLVVTLIVFADMGLASLLAIFPCLRRHQKSRRQR